MLTFCSRPGPRFGALSAVIHKLRRGNFLTRRACNGACRCCTMIDRSSFDGHALGDMVDGCFGGSCLDTISSLIGRRSVSLSSLGGLVRRIRRGGRRWLGSTSIVKLFFICVMGSSIYLTNFCLFCHLLLDGRAFRQFGEVTLLALLLLSLLLPLIRLAAVRRARMRRAVLAVRRLLVVTSVPMSRIAPTRTIALSNVRVLLVICLSKILFFTYQRVCSLKHLLVLLESKRGRGVRGKVALIVRRRGVSPFD